MLKVSEALARVLEAASPLPVVERPLEDCLGRWLADDVWADADQPPFDKALVDGFAVRSDDLRVLPCRLTLGETILAGQSPTRPLAHGEAAAITTGAPLPSNADVVVMHERTTFDNASVEIHKQPIQPGMNRLPRGRVYRAGDRLLAGGVELTPPRMGLLAAAGAARVRVIDQARVAVVPTGDELVDFREAPGPNQIRNSNSVMLSALLAQKDARVEVSPILPDDLEALREGLRKALESDVVLVIGGVSAGRKDLVPGVLQELGVREVFHKVRIKPGKPLWFGVGPARQERPPALVFGLPGNPMSGLVNFLVFVAPVLNVLHGRPARGPGIIPVRSAGAIDHRSDLETYVPARLVGQHHAPSIPTAERLEWGGSADMATIVGADGFLVLPDSETSIAPGEIVGFLPLR
ncbi:molybdopterin molybdotransferase MoeA [Paludisphaera rhizosphaerae]|uniref:molybdopterin molybdotransferase MoeA n=1 Tax=Paludisphaera rhizosphaerae TaxID=2711216 RepID=UPI0013EB6606|nr:gephyrin-like molybdotransferase Glp [Paludisphaera rhizosphaerae]